MLSCDWVLLHRTSSSPTYSKQLATSNVHHGHQKHLLSQRQTSRWMVALDSWPPEVKSDEAGLDPPFTASFRAILPALQAAGHGGRPFLAFLQLFDQPIRHWLTIDRGSPQPSTIQWNGGDVDPIDFPSECPKMRVPSMCIPLSTVVYPLRIYIYNSLI